MPQKVLIKRTSTPNSPPVGLSPGELAVEMGVPTRLWVGVPAAQDPSLRKLLSSTVLISDTPPPNPTHGLMWWESDAGILWVYYVDADSAQWVQAAGSAGGGAVGDFVEIAGDTMTGKLIIAAGGLQVDAGTVKFGGGNCIVDGPAGSYLNLNNVVGGGGATLTYSRGGLPRWTWSMTAAAEGGGNSGSTIELSRFSDAGAAIDAVMLADRVTGLVHFPIMARFGTGGVDAINAVFKVSYGGGGTQYGVTMTPTVDNATALWFNNASYGGVGSISCTTTGTAYNVASDARLKQDAQPFDAGPIIDATMVYDFQWIETGERAHGVIAQEALQTYPEAATYNADQDWYGVDYSKYVPLLLQELKAVRIRLAAVEAQLTASRR
jgi:hypothetical protein